jgi:isopenicillin-N epimerase
VWLLDPAVTFLNHGSFGACPRAVLDEQQRLREELEREPVKFLARELEDRLAAARAELGAFIGADPDDLAFVPNTTTGVNTVIRALRLAPDADVLTTDHLYRACRNALDVATADRGGRVVVARVPFPVASVEQVVTAVLGAVTPRTALAVLDHVTSPTGLIFPIARLVRELAARGIDTLVDGAHAPGMLDLDLRSIDAAYYVGNCHKWLCAPKGAAFLHVRRDRQPRIRPLVISHGASAVRPDRSRFRLEFDWTGTHDPTAYLAVPAAIRVMGAAVAGGWRQLRAANRDLALAARRTLAAALGIPLPCPDEMIGSLAALPLPPAPLPASGRDRWQERLFTQFAIEVPVIPWPQSPHRLLRISAQIYNRPADYARLAAALRVLAVDDARGVVS